MPGPRRIPLPSVPAVPVGLAANAALLNHCKIGSTPDGRLGSSPAAIARSRPKLVSELSFPLTTVIGDPVWYCCTPVNCQPPSTRALTPFIWLANGISQTYEVT